MNLVPFLLILIFPFGQLLRLDIVGSELVLHANDLAVFIVLLGWFALNSKNASSKMHRSPLFKPLTFWVFALLVSLVINLPGLLPREALISSLYLFRILAYAGLYFVFREEKNKSRPLRWLSLVTLAVAGSGLAQYLFAPDTTALAVEEWDNHYFRLIGPFLDPGFTGAVLVLGMILMFLTLKDFGDRIGLALSYIALALTYSRASYLMYLVAFAAISLFRHSAKIFVIAALILALTIPLLPKNPGEGTKLSRENSFWARIHNWQESLTIWKDHPIFGVGFNTYRYAQRDYGYLSNEAVAKSHAGAGADSSLFLVLATTGILGFAAFSNLLLQMWRSNPSAIFRVSLLAIVVHSFFNNTLFYPWVMEWLWLTFAFTEKT